LWCRARRGARVGTYWRIVRQGEEAIRQWQVLRVQECLFLLFDADESGATGVAPNS